MKKFEVIEHTADVGMRVFGRSLEELFENAAKALFSLILEHKSGKNVKEKIILKAETLEELLVTWLNELIFLFFTYDFLPVEYDIKIKENKRSKILNSTIKGGEFDICEKKVIREVKAATYHDLKVERIKGKWQADIIFDV